MWYLYRQCVDIQPHAVAVAGELGVKVVHVCNVKGQEGFGAERLAFVGIILVNK